MPEKVYPTPDKKALPPAPEVSHCVRCRTRFEGRPGFCDLRLGGCGRVYRDDAGTRVEWERMMEDRSDFRIPWEEALKDTTLIVLGEPEKKEDGVTLFREVREVIEEHSRLESTWGSAIAALFVMQSYVVASLPSVFYLMIGGRFGHGKTKLLRLIVRLTGGKAFENISVAALARELKAGATIGIDEYDVIRERDVQEVRDALVRQGYQADAAPYVRYDAAKRVNEAFPTFGPKVLTFRGGVEDALQSRGYIVAMGEVEGEEGFALVLRNMFPRLRGLPERLKPWGEEITGRWPPEAVQALMENGMVEEVRRAVAVFGGNRDSELTVSACAIAKIIEVDLGAELRKASEARSMAISASQDDDLDLLRDCLLSFATGVVQASLENEPTVKITHKDLRKAFDEARKARGDRRLTNAAFSALRRELGILDSWMKRPGNAVVYRLPTPYLTNLTNLTLPHMSKSEDGEDGEDGGASPRQEVARSYGIPPTPPLRSVGEPRRVDEQDAEEMSDFIVACKAAVLHGPLRSDAEIGAEIGRDLNLDPEDVRGRVTAVRQAIADGRTQGAVRT